MKAALEWYREEFDQEDIDNPDTDVRRAVSIAQKNLCRGWRQTSCYMDNAVARIEAKLDCDARYLRAIQALADALVERSRLDGDEAT